MIRCVVVDDEQHAIDLLTIHIAKIPMMDLQFSTTNPIEAFEYLQVNTTDLIFLDIHMPELDGIQFTKLLGGRLKVILTTAYSEYAVQGYEHNIIDYLIKPISFDRFLMAIEKVLKVTSTASFASREEEFIFVKTETRNKVIKILLRDIEYVEGLGNYVSFYTGSSKIVTLLTMKELEARLPVDRFIRIHRSYLVPINKIIAIDGNHLTIGKQQLPVGESYRESFFSMIAKHVLNKKK